MPLIGCMAGPGYRWMEDVSTSAHGQELMQRLDEIASRLQARQITPEQADAEATLALAAEQQAAVARADAAVAERRTGQRRRAAMVLAVIVAVLVATGTLSRIFH